MPAVHSFLHCREMHIELQSNEQKDHFEDVGVNRG